jgi:hypothetical protein
MVYKYCKGVYIMAKTRKTGKFAKGGYKNKRSRPNGVSRSGLPKIYPPNINPFLKAIKLG